jgi:hypothetical protein
MTATLSTSRLSTRRPAMTKTQRAMLAADLLPHLEKDAKERQRQGGGDKRSQKAKTQKKSVPATLPEPIAESREQAAKQTGASARNTSKAKKVIEQWAIGDGLYKRAAEITGLTEGTLMNYVSMSNGFQFSRRRENLTFRHHQEVASIKQIAEDKSGKLFLSDASQRAMLAADLLPHLEKDAKERQRQSKGRGKKKTGSEKGSAMLHDLIGRSDEQAAKQTGASARNTSKRKRPQRPAIFRCHHHEILQDRRETPKRRAGAPDTPFLPKLAATTRPRNRVCELRRLPTPGNFEALNQTFLPMEEMQQWTKSRFTLSSSRTAITT